MKRKGNIYPLLISDVNLEYAIDDVNRSHRWVAEGKPNRTVLWVESTKKERIKELRQIIEDGFEPAPTIAKRRYDINAKKWRDIHEPKLWPDQYVHHALIQALNKTLMRGMDPWCCGSIKGRGAIYGVRAIQKWMSIDRGRSKVSYCGEFDIHHFYDSLQPKHVMARMRQLIKDRKVLDLIERVMKYGILIGAYFSQWFANVTLQPLDHLIRQKITPKRYLRYIDNFTIFSNRRKDIQKVKVLIEKWLKEHDMELKGNWQIFKIKHRLPNALGYRYGHGFTLIRKHSLLTIKRQIASYQKKKRKHQRIPVKTAYSLLSRLGRLKHCNNVNLYKRFVPRKLQKELKDIIRAYRRDHPVVLWETVLAEYQQQHLAQCA